jgi:hypothetical protein
MLGIVLRKDGQTLFGILGYSCLADIHLVHWWGAYFHMVQYGVSKANVSSIR